MIDPPTLAEGTLERRAELDQIIDYAIQLLLEKARMVGWTSAEFLTAMMDAADARLSGLESEPILDQPSDGEKP